jgi:5'-3' exonuclease
MGIPSYYKNLIQNYPEIIIQNTYFNQTIDYLFLDLNCLIHPCCRNKTNEKEMFDCILEKINECIQITNVQTLLYIAIDGPAPRTKMEQQRQRRLKSSQENKIWDTNAITPGTQFMEQLNKFLKDKLNTFPVKTILSDSNEPGEGEHKIMKFMDTLPLNTINCVYGLDADLIMLSMIRNHHIYLLRETTEYNIEQVDSLYIYCDINLLKKYLAISLNHTQINIPQKTLIYDYLFMCFLLGNDFILQTPSVNIRYNGIDKLLLIYNELQQDFFGKFYILNDDKEICIQNFLFLLKKLSDNEYNLINDTLQIRNKQEHKMKYIYKSELSIYNQTNSMSFNDYHCDIDKYEQFINNIPILIRGSEKEVFKDVKYYKTNYYLYNLHNTTYYNPSFKQLLHNEIKDICHDYLKSLQWTVHYYFNTCLSWKWYYPHHIAPLLSDVYHYLHDIQSLDTLFTKDNIPYTPQEQLCIVLPQKSHGLIIDKSYLKDEYYYPESTPLHMFMKRYLWECHPYLPH